MSRKLICLGSFVLVLLAITAATHAQVDNLVMNPSFEEDEAILDDPAWEQWCTWNPAEGAGSNATIVDTEAVDGTRSLMIEPVGPENWHFIVLSLPIPTEVGASYTTSFWAKAAEPRPLGVQYKATDNSVQWGYADFDLTTEWAEYTLTADALNSETKLEFFCASVEVAFWLDSVSVIKVGDAPPVDEPTDGEFKNLALNPSLEEDEVVLDDPDWYAWCTWNPAEGAGSKATIVDTEAVDGKRSLLVEPVGVENWHFIVTNISSPAEVGKDYTVSFWAKAQEPRPLSVEFKAADNSVTWGYTDFQLTTEWAEYSMTSASESDALKPEFYCAGVEVPFWLDFLNIYEGQYIPGIEPKVPVTISVDPSSDLAAANELAQPGDTIEFAEGTYNITSQIEIKDGVTYRGAGQGLTIIDGNDTTRAFAALGDRFFNEDSENANDSGPKGWVLEGMTIQNCVADTNNRFSYTSAAYNLKTNLAELDADVSGGLNPEEADGQVGGIRLAGPDGTEGTEDDDLHRFEHIDTDGSGELSKAELDAQLLLQEDEFGDQNGDGGAITILNQAVGTIQNCEFLNNHTPAEGDGDDGGAISISGLSIITINDCLFDGNYAVSPDSVAVEGWDGDGGHIKVQGNSASAITPGTTLIANRCVFLNGNASDDAGAIQSAAVGSIVRLDSCWFEGNTSWDNGNVCQFSNNTQHEVTVTNCVFVNNVTKADNSPDRMIETNRNSKFINCTFVSNNQEDQDLIYNNANIADTDGAASMTKRPMRRWLSIASSQTMSLAMVTTF